MFWIDVITEDSENETSNSPKKRTATDDSSSNAEDHSDTESKDIVPKKKKRKRRVIISNCVHPTGGHAWFPVISRKSIYPTFTKFGMGVYWVNSLYGIAFGEDSSIAN